MGKYDIKIFNILPQWQVAVALKVQFIHISTKILVKYRLQNDEQYTKQFSSILFYMLY